MLASKLRYVRIKTGQSDRLEPKKTRAAVRSGAQDDPQHAKPLQGRPRFS